MNSLENLSADIKSAMKNKETLRLEALRSIKSELDIAFAEKGADGDIKPERAIAAVQKVVKQYKETAEKFKELNRQDEHDVEYAKALLASAYLPQEEMEWEIEHRVNQFIELHGKQVKMGEVISSVKADIVREGKMVNGQLLSSIVKKALN